MCQQPCATCIVSSQFSQCLSCQSSQFVLKDTLCVKQPIQIIQIVCLFLLLIFIIPVLMRKRCVTLIRIFDAIQIVAYFKYINGFLANRQNYLYLGMRAWGDWSQGWNLVVFDGDITLPIWTIEETIINKVIRICIIWTGVVMIMLIFGLLATMNDPALTLCNYIFKNFPTAICIGFYMNIQDMALVMANAYYSSLTQSPFTDKLTMIQLAIGIVFAVIFLALMVWMFYRINFDFNKELEKTQKKIYPHVYLFILAMDYDLFQTYELTTLPEREKKIHRYSNLRLIEIFKKAAYSFLIINSLYTTNQSLTGEAFSITGFLVFFDVIWYIALPYDLKTQKIQFILCVIGDILVIVILIIPIFFSFDLLQMILCLVLYLLAIISVVLEFFLDVYKLIPVDLYETGLNVVIEDKRLLKELQERKRLQQQHQKMMKEMQEKNKRLQAQLQAKRNQQQNNDKLHPKKSKDDTQQSLPNNDHDKDQVSQDMIDPNNNDLLYEGQDYQQNTQMNSDDLAEMYKIDQQKRRKIYQFNKKAAFTYSNKVQY